ncbi:addiction module antidote protein, HigA family [Candidatus Kaiserbacteria bacterium RIFCSPLOWO2_01_FULL_54_24]|uniref:Addiction module antidote protein, HigA family n=1 Tax=Candidatus Kaiserbacteria bacterium RIFCSPLOWO2_01_FULL_54_24 TaxID=1798515 RepID=A0A1F6EW80_9BACT|nr:MAG: addiction module antidote protein, HigA family [Candidatus Kaiserbacteria bacterium RIFCSPLOWO2_01_FULL_54_24]
MTKKIMKTSYNIHPGEILAEEFLKPLGLTEYRLAKSTSMPPRRVNEIVRGTRSVTADTALRLARFFGTTAQFWMTLQIKYDLAASERALTPLLRRAVVPLSEIRRT